VNVHGENGSSVLDLGVPWVLWERLGGDLAAPLFNGSHLPLWDKGLPNHGLAHVLVLDVWCGME